MIGVFVNVGAIIIGSTIGLLLRKGLSEKLLRVVMQGIGLSVVIIGIMGALETKNVLLLVLSLAIGGMIGSLLRIEDRLENLGEKIERKFSSNEGSFSKGFVMASLIYCVGAMAIVGSIEAGVEHSYETLYIKSLLDGITSIVLTSTLGFGVMFSAISVLLYQGTIVLLGNQASVFLTEEIINEVSAVGGVLILGIGITMLDIKKIHVGDLLPAVFIPILWLLLYQAIF